MILSTADSDLFFETFLPLVKYVNDIHNVSDDLKNPVRGSLYNTDALLEIVEILSNNIKLIDAYVDENKTLAEDTRSLLLSWKRLKLDKFIIVRHLKKGSIFISTSDSKVYQVYGLTSTWEEMTMYRPVPVILKTVLIPFKNVITSIGIASLTSVSIGPNIKKGLVDEYLQAKKEGRVLKTM